MDRPTLFAIHYSPWSIRARWALDHHGIDYEYREHTPLLGEAPLRWRAKRAGVPGRVSVPILFHSRGACSDSWDIIRYADMNGHGPSLQTNDPYVASWFPRLEPAYDAGRRRLTRAILNDEDALLETAEATVPAWLAGTAKPLASIGVRFIGRKYQFDLDVTDNLRPLTNALDDIRKALKGKNTIYKTFSAADMAAACLIGTFSPHGTVAVGDAVRSIWHHPQLSKDYSDLVAWRDELMA